MNFKIKMLKNVVSVLCAAVMATSSGVVTSVGAAGGKQIQISQKKAKKRFDKLSKGMNEKRNAFINWIVSGIAEVESIEIFTTSSNNANDLFNKIDSSWDKNTLDKQNELINEYENVINNCIKVMDDYRAKYTKKESANESQMSILNIDKEVKKIEDNKDAKKERIASRKDELQSLYDNFKKVLENWKKLEPKMTNNKMQRIYLKGGFNNCIKAFSKIVGHFGVINEKTLLESELTEKDINNLVQNVNKVMRDSEDLIKKYIKQTEEIQKDRKNRIKEQRLKYEQKRKEFDKWKEFNGITPKQDTNSLAYYKVQQKGEKLKNMQKYEEKDVEEYSSMVDEVIKAMDNFVKRANDWQIIDDNKDLNNDENDGWEILD